MGILDFLCLGVDKPSPSDFIRQDGIKQIDNNIVIDLSRCYIPFTSPPRVWIPSIPDTNSMDPVFDIGHNNILIAGANEADHKKLLDYIQPGDVAVYRMMESDVDSPGDFTRPHKFYAIHRVSKVGHDKDGRYFKFRGDNSWFGDGWTARDRNILNVSIGTIY